MDLTDPVQVLAGTLYGEARGIGPTGMRDVASTIMNRVNHPRWWGHDIISVCLDPWQFSCWNGHVKGQPVDPNYPKIMALPGDDPWYGVALSIANQTILGQNSDLTIGADSYFALSMKARPFWTERATHTVDRAGQSYWRVELAKPGTVTPDEPHGDPAAPNGHPNAVTADSLMAAEQAQLDAGQTPQTTET